MIIPMISDTSPADTSSPKIRFGLFFTSLKRLAIMQRRKTAEKIARDAEKRLSPIRSILKVSGDEEKTSCGRRNNETVRTAFLLLPTPLLRVTKVWTNKKTLVQ